MLKNFFVIIILIVILVYGYYVFYLRENTPPIDVRNFNGQIVSIEGNQVTLSGVFVASTTLPLSLQSQREFSFLVDDSTKFNKLQIMMPTYESFRLEGKTSGSYSIDDLPKVEGAGSLDDLKRFIGHKGTVVQVEFPISVHNKKIPTASLIFYQSLVEPPENI